MLLKKGADYNATNKHDANPAVWAEQYGYTAIQALVRKAQAAGDQPEEDPLPPGVTEDLLEDLFLKDGGKRADELLPTDPIAKTRFLLGLALQLSGKGSITVFFNVGHANGGGKACRCGGHAAGPAGRHGAAHPAQPCLRHRGTIRRLSCHPGGCACGAGNLAAFRWLVTGMRPHVAATGDATS